LHPVGGHTPEMQFVRVHTARGWVVVASDVSHYYENMETGRPFTAAFHISEMLEVYDKLCAHAPTPHHIIPGHDPLVMRCYPAPRPKLLMGKHADRTSVFSVMTEPRNGRDIDFDRYISIPRLVS
jgi:glyoxylase-like metal-dependent hydrolase (beta-lactamase superfamily II)